MATAKQTPLTLRLGTAVKKAENLYAYVVDQSGKIVETVPFKGTEAALKSSDSVVQGQNRVYVGQALPKQLEAKANERMLIKAGAYQVQKSVQANAIDIAHVPAAVFNPLNFGTCLIQGNISNTTTINGAPVTTPLCHARVHIVEVEVDLLFPPLPLAYHIPDWVIQEIQQKLPKPPTPGPVGPVSRVQPTIAKNATLHGATPMLKPNAAAHVMPAAVSRFAASPVNTATLARTAAAPLAAALPQEMKLAALPPLPDHVLSAIASPTLDAARKAIAANIAQLHPYFCLWPHLWPWIYHWDEDHIVSTDNTGHFEFVDALFDEEGPLNIYIWVEALIDGQWVTVYNPPMPCNTHWNYQCNSPINIGLNDSRIAPCSGNIPPGSITWIKRIGNGTTIPNIAMEAASSAKPSLFTDARGLTSYQFHAKPSPVQWVSPFSGAFPIYVQFGSALPGPAATHFRWKRRRIADADLTPVTENFVRQDGALGKFYTYEGPDGHGNIVDLPGVFPLEVSTAAGTIYKIPHLSAPMDVPLQPTAVWGPETVALIVNASGMPNGLYEFVLELCDGTGAVQQLSSNDYQIDLPSAAPQTQSTPANSVDSNYFVNDSESYGFRFLLRIDNDVTHCGIYDAMVVNGDGSTATTDTQCGFALYKPDAAQDKLLMRFYARQPHNFAEYSFQVTRGNGNNVATADSVNQVPEPHISVPTTAGPVDCQGDPRLSDALGPCQRAAFAENLYVRAFHTDGSQQVYWYDSMAVAAIAVEPV